MLLTSVHEIPRTHEEQQTHADCECVCATRLLDISASPKKELDIGTGSRSYA
jgi:hypothetical protein